MHKASRVLAKKSYPLSLKLKGCLLYNFLQTYDCQTNVVQLQRNIFPHVSLNDHQTSFPRFLEHANRFLRETFEMLFPGNHQQSDN